MGPPSPLPWRCLGLALLSVSVPFTRAIDDIRIDVLSHQDCDRPSRVRDDISVHYNGTLTDGTPFDSSYTSGNPIEFMLGVGEMILGFDKGLLDCCIGDVRRLTIPSSMGYGNAPVGPIPGGSTLSTTSLPLKQYIPADNVCLVFETKLMSINGETEPPTPSEIITPSIPEDNSQPLNTTADPQSDRVDATKHKPRPGAENGECRLLGPFALFVQAGLGLLAVLVLVWKRYREKPRRPLKVWSFDASKQVLGSALLHVTNLIMSIIFSKDVTDKVAHASAVLAESAPDQQPNPCSWYLINIAVDTTIGIPILIVILRLLHQAAAITPLANPPESIKSGHYGEPPRTTWWLKQSLLYFIGLLLMKLCVFFIFAVLPWIAWVGDWALRWTEGNEAIQITFVMFIFPLIVSRSSLIAFNSAAILKESPDECRSILHHRQLHQGWIGWS